MKAAEICNTFFSEILVRMLQRRPLAIPNFYPKPKLTNCFPFVKPPLHLLLSKLSRSKATGPDNIPAKLLKECPDLIGESLSLTFLINHLKQVYFLMIGKMLESPLSTKIRASAMIHQIIAPFR